MTEGITDVESATTGLYTASEVEQRTGVQATTLRQWERRYGIPKPTRNESGYRLYSPLDLQQIEFLLARIAEGIAVSRAAELCRQAFHVHEAPSEHVHPHAATARALRAALVASDHARATELLSDAHARYSVEDVLVRIIQPALHDIGESWARGEITVAHEHQASAFLRARIAQLLQLAAVDAWGPAVVATCGPGELHEIGLLMLSVVLRRRGVRVHYLGPSTPLQDVGVYARQVGANGVLISVQTPLALRELRAHEVALRELGVPVFLGGAVFNEAPHAAAELGGTYLGPDAVQATSALLRVLKERRRE